MSRSPATDNTYHAYAAIASGARRMLLACLVVLIVAGISVSIAFALRFNAQYEALSAWGVWVGTFISSLALLGTAYAVISQIRQGETTSWSIALSRLGTLYDLALNNSDFAQMLAEPSIRDGDPQPLYPPYTLTAEQRVWLGSLFLAYEQIFVATLSLSAESRRVWHIYIGNQLNKPSIRAQFCRDAVQSLDYHQAFWRFAHDHAIRSRFFERYRTERKSTVAEKPLELSAGGLRARPMAETELEFWRSLYSDPAVQRQMYAAPLGSDEEFKAFLRKRTLFTVYEDQEPIGGFSLTRDGEFMATFGFLIAQAYRGKHHSGAIVQMLETQARRMGIRTLRADVYEDNVPSIRALERQNFRRFIWVEKNL